MKDCTPINLCLYQSDIEAVMYCLDHSEVGLAKSLKYSIQFKIDDHVKKGEWV